MLMAWSRRFDVTRAASNRLEHVQYGSWDTVLENVFVARTNSRGLYTR